MRSNSMCFFVKSELDKGLSKAVLGAQVRVLGNPYLSAGYHVTALLYPFAHALRALNNATNVLEGLGHLVVSICEGNTYFTTLAISGIINEVKALVFNLINTIASLASFAIRTLETVFSFGYVTNSFSGAVDAITASEGTYAGAHASMIANFGINAFGAEEECASNLSLTVFP